MKRIAIIVLLLLVLIGCGPRQASVPALSATPVVIALDAAEQPTPPPASPPPTAPPTPAPTQAYESLPAGAQGEAVDALQQRLSALGYIPATACSGTLDTVTAHGYGLFAKAAGLPVALPTAHDALALLYSDDAPACTLPLASRVIGLDPGHQAHGNSGMEPVAPGASERKKKVSSGTSGRTSGVPEYKVNLAVGLLLQSLLAEQGAIIVMTRTTNDVDISNSERAKLFNEANTEYALRLHCNGSGNTDKKGAFMLVPKKNPFVADCERAAKLLIDAYCEETGLSNLGLTYRGDQTGFNWCERMIINIEMGHMTNPAEDEKLTDAAFQETMAQGLYNGILAYFAAENG